MYVKNEILNGNDVMEEVHTEGENKSVNVEIKYWEWCWEIEPMCFDNILMLKIEWNEI